MSALTEANSTKEAALRRRSIRQYTDEPVPKELLEEILLVAGRAPNSANIQPWKVHVVTNKEFKQELQPICDNQPQVGRCQALLVFNSNMEVALANLESTLAYFPPEELKKRAEKYRKAFGEMSEAEREAWARGQTYIFLGYFLLVAASYGLGTSPMLGFHEENLKAALKLPANSQIPAIVAVGWPAQEGFHSDRLPLDRLVQYWD